MFDNNNEQHTSCDLDWDISCTQAYNFVFFYKDFEITRFLVKSPQYSTWSLTLLYKSRIAACIYLCEKKFVRCTLSNSNNLDESNIHIARWNFWWPLLSIDIISLILYCSISWHKLHLNLLIALFGRHISHDHVL